MSSTLRGCSLTGGTRPPGLPYCIYTTESEGWRATTTTTISFTIVSCYVKSRHHPLYGGTFLLPGSSVSPTPSYPPCFDTDHTFRYSATTRLPPLLFTIHSLGLRSLNTVKSLFLQCILGFGISEFGPDSIFYHTFVGSDRPNRSFYRRLGGLWKSSRSFCRICASWNLVPPIRGSKIELSYEDFNRDCV